MTAARLIPASGVLLAYVLFCLLIFLAHRRKRQRAAREVAALLGSDDAAGSASGAPPVLVAFASQTGFAEQLAWRTAHALRASGRAIRVAPLAQVDAPLLATTTHALFIVSTAGEGDPPDNAIGFARRVMGASATLSSLRYGLLALGDRSYVEYCAFGRALDGWLRHHGGSPLFDRVEVDNGEESALRHWQQQLGALGGDSDAADWAPAKYERWKLVERQHLNEGSPGGPAFHLALEPMDGTLSMRDAAASGSPDAARGVTWRAGDIAEIGPRHGADEVARFLEALALDGTAMVQVDGARDTLSRVVARSRLPRSAEDYGTLRGLAPQALADALDPAPHREYSIASLPRDGRMELLVRQVRLPDGRLGLGSGWLTEHAAVGEEIALRVRENPGFHPPEDERPLILIGNGTGLAGLRAHLKARAAAGHHRNWLLFGERTAAHDYFHRAEIGAWQASGVLTRVDLAFSRDLSSSGYVQDRLCAATSDLRAWVDEGAAIYVCGSLQGMAAGVHAVLTDALGAETLERMAEDGRYRRDVY